MALPIVYPSTTGVLRQNDGQVSNCFEQRNPTISLRKLLETCASWVLRDGNDHQTVQTYDDARIDSHSKNNLVSCTYNAAF